MVEQAFVRAKDSLRIERIMELKTFLNDNDSVLERFEDELFGRLIDKVMVTSLVEVTFIFKTGVEVREVLDNYTKVPLNGTTIRIFCGKLFSGLGRIDKEEYETKGVRT